MYKLYSSFKKSIQDDLIFVGLVPELKLARSDWNIFEISVREEGKKWNTFWYRVATPNAKFRVKQFFLDIMEPSFPDTCIYNANGYCYTNEKITYWKGINYKGKESYVLSLWKTQIEISIDDGNVEQDEMEKFLLSLIPIDKTKAETIIRKPFHQLSFHARTGKGGSEIGRSNHWTSPSIKDYSALPLNLPKTWELESVGYTNQETQYIYWDSVQKVYSLWALKQKEKNYYSKHSWIRNYSTPISIGKYELYFHPTRGTVVFESLEKECIVYVFRGTPSTTQSMVKEFLGIN
ncbi:hypothetical protein AB1280_15165 [Bacillus sp. S10(2024)]